MKRLLWRACEQAGGQKPWADANGVLPQIVSDVLHGRRHPPPALLAALGLERMPAEYRKVAAKPKRRTRDGG